MGGNDVQLSPSNNPVSRSGTGNSGPANTTGGAASYSATGSAPGSAAGQARSPEATQNINKGLKEGAAIGHPKAQVELAKGASLGGMQELDSAQVCSKLTEMFRRQLL